MGDKKWNVGELMGLANSYWATAALHAGVRIGITTRLLAGPANPQQLADGLGLDARATCRLCTALAALQVLDKDGDTYSLPQELREFLDPESPRSKVDYILHMADMMADWAQLAGCVTYGRPVERREQGQDISGQERRHFYRGMRDIAVEQAPGLAARLGLKAGQHVLDLAGGPGVYALTFCDEVEDLRATVMDLSNAEPFFRQEAARHAGAERVEFVVGDYMKQPLGGPYDVIWISQVLHGEGPQVCQQLISKAAGVLRSGGELWVQEFVLEPDQPRHPWPALFALNMIINTATGDAYTAGEIAEFMQKAGLAEARMMGPTKEKSPASLMRAVKP